MTPRTRMRRRVRRWRVAQADSAAPKAPAQAAPVSPVAAPQPEPAVAIETPPASTEAYTHYHFEPFIPTWMLLALAGLILLGVRRAYTRSTRAIKPEYKMVLGFVRLSACGLLLLCLTRTVAVTTHWLNEKG